jgi:hypothetical protein
MPSIVRGRRNRYPAVMMFLLLVIAACGTTEPPPPTRIPSATPTRISTALPYIPTAVPAGLSAQNPLRLLIVPPDLEAAEGAEETLADFIAAANDDLAVDVALSDDAVQALTDLCTPREQLTAVWVDGLSYAIALARNCGVATAALQADGELGLGATLFIDDTLEADERAEGDYQTIVEGTYCRLSLDDLYSWTLPLLAFRAQGFDLADFNAVDDYDTYDELIENVQSGACTGAAIPRDMWRTATRTDLERVEHTAQVPYGVLVFPRGASLDVVSGVMDALLPPDVATTPTPDPDVTADPTRPTATPRPTLAMETVVTLFGDGELVRVNAADFDDYLDFLQAADLNLAELGN